MKNLDLAVALDLILDGADVEYAARKSGLSVDSLEKAVKKGGLGIYRAMFSSQARIENILTERQAKKAWSAICI